MNISIKSNTTTGEHGLLYIPYVLLSFNDSWNRREDPKRFAAQNVGNDGEDGGVGPGEQDVDAMQE